MDRSIRSAIWQIARLPSPRALAALTRARVRPLQWARSEIRTMKPHTLALSFALAALAACAAAPDDPTNHDVTSEEALRANVAPGVFVLHKDPMGPSDDPCEVHTRLTLTSAGEAELEERTSTACGERVENRRSYRLRATATSCRGQDFSGSAGRAATRRTITIHDRRRATCLPSGGLTVIEQLPSEDPRVLFGSDQATVAETVTLDGTLVGAANDPALRTSTETVALLLDELDTIQFTTGKRSRARGVRRRVDGAFGPLDVRELIVCPDSGTTLACAPPAGPHPLCASDRRSWVEIACAGVTFGP
jgi:hypothetical protein